MLAATVKLSFSRQEKIDQFPQAWTKPSFSTLNQA